MSGLRVVLVATVVAATFALGAGPVAAADDGYFYRIDITSVECSELGNGNVFMNVSGTETIDAPTGSTTGLRWSSGGGSSISDHPAPYVVVDQPFGIGANMQAPPPIERAFHSYILLADGTPTYESTWTLRCDDFGTGTFELVSEDFFPEPDPVVPPTPTPSGEGQAPAAAVATTPRFTG